MARRSAAHERDQYRARYGIVVQVPAPCFIVKLIGAELQLVEGEDLTMGWSPLRYHIDHRIVVGDKLALDSMGDGDYRAIDVITPRTFVRPVRYPYDYHPTDHGTGKAEGSWGSPSPPPTNDAD